MSICLTAGIQVAARPFFLPEHSQPHQNRFVWGYEITVVNQSDHAVQLVDRHWIITDGRGCVEHVEGPGVVGQQPFLEAGESFSYRSFCPLKTSHGFMRGSFGMVRADGERFEAAVASFVLMPPWMLN